jgi:hypothetical protein
VFNPNYGNAMEILGLGYKYISMIPVIHQKVNRKHRVASLTLFRILNKDKIQTAARVTEDQ